MVPYVEYVRDGRVGEKSDPLGSPFGSPREGFFVFGGSVFSGSLPIQVKTQGYALRAVTELESIMDVLDQITELARRVAGTHGLDLVDVELFRAGRRRMVRIYVGKAAGVSVDDCARVSREVSAVLDAENWLGDDSYVIEVSSPGLDRPFKTLADWQRNIGRDVKVTCREKVDGKIMFAGKLVSADDSDIALEGAAGTVTIPMALVALAKIDVKFN